MSTAPSTSVSAHPAIGMIVPAVTLAHGYYRNMLDGVTPETFARMPEGVCTNHPAFILGHLALYSGKVLEGLGIEGAAIVTEEQATIFSMDAECQDDPDGTIYPPMAEVVDLFDRVMTMAIEKMPEVSSELLDSAPEGEPFGGLVKTMAAMANFILVAHPMMHAGQFSTWRRCMGLGQCPIM